MTVTRWLWVRSLLEGLNYYLLLKYIKLKSVPCIPQQGRQRERIAKTLLSPLSAKFWRYGMLNDGTPRYRFYTDFIFCMSTSIVFFIKAIFTKLNSYILLKFNFQLSFSLRDTIHSYREPNNKHFWG